MHFILAILLSIGFQANSLPSLTLAQGSVSNGSPEIVLHLKAPQVTATNVKLGYEIPYPGYIEFHLFDGKGEKIWADYGVRDKGEHYQSLKRDKLEAGVSYKFEFWYKGKPYPGNFSI